MEENYESLPFTKEGYTVFIEIVHGCNRKDCTTRTECPARNYAETHMNIKMLNSLLISLSKNIDEINKIMFYGRGDSTEFDMSEVVIPDIVRNKVAACFTSPYKENYPVDIRRVARVDNYAQAKELNKSNTFVNKTFTIVKRSFLFELDKLIILLKQKDVEVTLAHFDPRFAPNPAIRNWCEHVPLNEIEKYLFEKGFAFERMTQMPVSSFRDERAFIIDTWGNVVPCFYIDRPYFQFVDFNTTISKIMEISRPCVMCLSNQPKKWKLRIINAK